MVKFCSKGEDSRVDLGFDVAIERVGCLNGILIKDTQIPRLILQIPFSWDPKIKLLD